MDSFEKKGRDLNSLEENLMEDVTDENLRDRLIAELTLRGVPKKELPSEEELQQLVGKMKSINVSAWFKNNSGTISDDTLLQYAIHQVLNGNK